jgi:ferredoxin
MSKPIAAGRSALRIHVNHELCAGTGQCVRICPSVFELREGWAEVTLPVIGPEHEAAAREAVELCPTKALEVLDGT